MKLIDKIQKAHSGKLSDYSTIYTPTANAIERIADDYAIEFGDWIGKNAITYHNGKFRMKTLTPVFRTSEQLLERFKIEKGL